MIQAHRYLVWWHSAITGEHAETYSTANRANQRLADLEARAHFDGGVVIDQIESGAQRTPEAFRALHDRHPDRQVAPVSAGESPTTTHPR